MSIELKTLLRKMLFYDAVIGLLACVLVFILFNMNLMFIFLIGFVLSVANFVLSGILLEKNLKSKKSINKILLPVSYIIRILIIILVAIPFIKELSTIVAFLLGFIMHFPILIFSWFNSQKGSE